MQQRIGPLRVSTYDEKVNKSEGNGDGTDMDTLIKDYVHAVCDVLQSHKNQDEILDEVSGALNNDEKKLISLERTVISGKGQSVWL